MNHHHIRPLLDIFGRFGRHCQHHYQQVLCALCGWPMCSEECSRRKPHADLECRLFRYRNGYDDVEDDDGGGGGGGSGGGGGDNHM